MAFNFAYMFLDDFEVHPDRDCDDRKGGRRSLAHDIFERKERGFVRAIIIIFLILKKRSDGKTSKNQKGQKAVLGGKFLLTQGREQEWQEDKQEKQTNDLL